MGLLTRWLLIGWLLSSGLYPSSVVNGKFGGTRSALAAGAIQTSNPDDTRQVRRGIPALAQALRDLTQAYSVMMVATRPGDEDTGLLTYYRRKYGARTSVVFVTNGRPDLSGHNLSNAKSEDEQALMALHSARLEAADTYFLNLPWEGAPGSTDKILADWGCDHAAGLLVAAIRLIKPDVVVVKGPGLGADQGMRAAAGTITDIAFEAAGDGYKYSEAGPTWRPRRLFQSTGPGSAQVTVSLKQYDRLWGSTYQQLAEDARVAYQDTFASRLVDPISYYKLVKAIDGDSFKEGATLFDGLKLTKEVAELIAPPVLFDTGPRGPTELPNAASRALEEAIGRPAALIDALVDRLVVKRVEVTHRASPQSPGVDLFREKHFIDTLEQAIALVLGIDVEVQLNKMVLIPGEAVTARVKVRNGSDRTFGVELDTPQQLPLGQSAQPPYKSRLSAVEPNGELSEEFKYQVPNGASPTLPHRSPLGLGFYPSSSAWIGWDERFATGAELRIFAKILLGGTTATIPAIAQFDVAAPVEMSVAPPVALIKDWSSTRTIFFTVDILNRIPDLTDAELWVVALGVVKDNYTPAHLSFSQGQGEVRVPLALEVPVLKPPLGTDIVIELRRPGTGPSSERAIASVRIPVDPVNVDVAAQVNVGVVAGPDDVVSLALDELGVQHHLVTVDDLKFEAEAADLDRFQDIIVEPSAYDSYAGLATYNDRLLEYARKGGNLVVLPQYSGQAGIGGRSVVAAPYPFTSSEMTLKAGDPANISIADSPVLSSPNKISARDLALLLRPEKVYAPAAFSTEYQPLIGVKVADEGAVRALAFRTMTGAGTYTYTSFNWGPALASMDPGAYRLLADLISVPRGSKPSPPSN